MGSLRRLRDAGGSGLDKKYGDGGTKSRQGGWIIFERGTREGRKGWDKMKREAKEREG